MDVQDIVIQYLMCFLVLVQLACSFQPLIVTAAGNTVDFAQFADRMFVCLLLNFTLSKIQPKIASFIASHILTMSITVPDFTGSTP